MDMVQRITVSDSVIQQIFVHAAMGMVLFLYVSNRARALFWGAYIFGRRDRQEANLCWVVMNVMKNKEGQRKRPH